MIYFYLFGGTKIFKSLMVYIYNIYPLSSIYGFKLSINNGYDGQLTKHSNKVKHFVNPNYPQIYRVYIANHPVFHQMYIGERYRFHLRL